MKIAFVLNRFSELKPDQSSATLISHCAHRGHEVWVLELAELVYGADGEIGGLARPVRPLGRYVPNDLRVSAELGSPEAVDLSAVDLLWLRTNPGRDPERPWAHSFVLQLALSLQSRGVVVLNDPSGLRRASDKLYGLELPESVRPRSFVSRDRDALIAFVLSCGEAVLKPLSGSQGRDVFRVSASDLSNANQIIDVISRSGYVLAQRFVPEAKEGDTRMILLDGEVMIKEGRVAGVRRIPSDRDFRSNVHVGGRSAPAEPDGRTLQAAEAIGPILRRDGIFLCGLDIIGGLIIEVNVFSPGGLQPAFDLYGIDFTETVIERAEARVWGAS